MDMLNKAKLLYSEARIVTAFQVLERVDAFINGPADANTKQALQAELAGAKEEIDMIRVRGKECLDAIVPEPEGEGSKWIFAQSLFGADTYYRLENGQLHCKVVGVFKDSLSFDQSAILREVGLYNTWGPFVSKSSLLKRHSDYDSTFHFHLAIPMLPR